ncbi:MAG TPA: DNA translocase FtsK [Ktedonosporobacter sp.]|nr:DNA translocase FtsK [Ktedonosporobacter sp.]
MPSIDQGTSRVSRAAGSVGSQGAKDAQAEQRTHLAAAKQNVRGQGSVKQTPRGKTGQGSKKPGPSRPAPSVVPSRPAAADPKDTQFIKWAGEKWNALEPHHQQRVFSILLLLLSLLLFGALTFFRTVPVLHGIYGFFITFFGWSSYLLALGLVAFAAAHLYEGIRNLRIIRWSMVIGLLFIWLLLLVESRLWTSHLAVGVLAELLVAPLLGWPAVAIHLTLLGLLVLAIIWTFRISFGDILMVADFIQRLLADPRQTSPEKKTGPSQYLGQRPQYSRYGAGKDPALVKRQGAVLARPGRRGMIEEEDEEDGTPIPQRQAAGGRQGRRPLIGDDEDEGNVEFEADFDGEEPEEDPLNDINIHRQEVGFARGGRSPQALNLGEHNQAVQGVRQQQLPFKDASDTITRKAVKPNMMEPLAPNPRQAKGRGATNAGPTVVSLWKLPTTVLLNTPEDVKLQMLGDDTGGLARTIQETLRSFRVDAEVRQEDISIGPTVIRFGIRPTGKPEMKLDEKTGKMVPVRDAAGNIIYEVRTRVSRIMALQNDLALVLEAKAIRMEAPVPGRPYVGVEIPNKNSRLVTLREVLESKEYLAAKAKSRLAIALGKDVAGMVRVGDLARMPHLLIAGATGAGKSVSINVIIASIITQATPDDVRMLMVDPKMVELNMYNGIPHLLSPVVTEVDKVVPLLKNAISEMERRYRLFSQLGVRNLDSYRKLRLEKIGKGDTSLNNLPAIVIIIDELADLMMAAPEEVEGMICRLAQLARATGIHLVIATQRPSVDVITGLIKANIPTRISFMVSSAVDSRTIIDMGGAERLLGRGDMLYLPADAGRPERIQCSFLADEEAERLVEYWRQQIIDHAAATVKDKSELAAIDPSQPRVEPGWEIREEASDDFELDDDLLEKAEEVVREYGKASISLLQRRLRIGYSRAARLIDLLEEHGIIGHSESGGRSREILENGNGGGYERRNSGEGHSLAAEADDIMAEERARNEFLRKQAEMRQNQQVQPQQQPRRPMRQSDDMEG